MSLNALSTTFRLASAAALISLFAATGCSSAGSSSHLLYVATGNGIFAYRIDNKSGNATSIFTAPFIVGNTPSAIAITPSDQFAYVTNQQDNTISQLRIDTTSGTLSEVLPRVSTGISPAAMVMDPSGSFLYVADQGTNDLEAFSIGTNGTLKLTSTTSLRGAPSALVLSGSGNVLYVTVPNLNAIYVFSVSSGNLTPVANSPFLVANGLATPASNPAGSFLYVPNPAANTITGYASNSGVLTPLPGSPYGTTTTTNLLNSPTSLIVDPTGTYLYAANFGASSLVGFTIASNGDLTPLATSPGSAGTNPNLMTLDRAGKFLYVGNAGANSINVFSFGTAGALTSSNTIQVGTVARGLAFTK